MNKLSPISRSERIELLNVLRGIAICGILIVLRYFVVGPTEWVWRQLTYKKRIPLMQN